MGFSDYQQFRTPLSHRICDMIEMPDDLCTNCGYIEIVSNTCALVDGCKGVLEYTEELIKLDLGKKYVSFSGNSLTIKSLSMEQALVEGFIARVEFCN